MARRIAAVVVAGLGLLLPPHAAAGTSKTIRVDCSTGQSISRALQDKSETLIIEISGMCEEDVQIQRSNVTLRGTDPALDGIRAAEDEPLDQALNVFGVHRVVIENLKLTGGRVGLGINGSFAVDVVNCRVESNEVAGVIVGTASGSIDLIDSVITGNGNLGIWVADGGLARCLRCTVESNPARGAAIRVTQGSELLIDDSTVSGFRGIDAAGGSRVLSFLASSSVEGQAAAIRARGTTSLELLDASIIGQLELRQGSTLVLSNATQTSSGANTVLSGSTLVARGTTSLAGDLSLREFSRATLPSGTTVAGSLSCGLGADAFCDDPMASVGGTSDCGSCPKP